MKTKTIALVLSFVSKMNTHEACMNSQGNDDETYDASTDNVYGMRFTVAENGQDLH